MEKKLYKNKKDKIVGGVCSGIADYMDIDPTAVRLFFLLFTLACGLGIIAYIGAMILMPRDPEFKKKGL